MPNFDPPADVEKMEQRLDGHEAAFATLYFPLSGNRYPVVLFRGDDGAWHYSPTVGRHVDEQLLSYVEPGSLRPLVDAVKEGE